MISFTPPVEVKQNGESAKALYLKIEKPEEAQVTVTCLE